MKRIAAIVCLLGVAAIFAERATYYFPFLSDDALISLRYAQRLLDGHGLTWTDGEWVEGYTDLAWVLLTALLGLFRVDLIVAARALGVFGALAALIFTSFKPSKPAELSPVRVLTGALFLALSDPLAAWSVGALEHAFESGVTVAAAWLLMRGLEEKRERIAFLSLLVLIAWLRADGAVIISGLLAGNAVRGLLAREGFMKTLRANVMLGLVPLGALVAQLLFRRAYYGAWVPNTALVKVSFSLARVELGWSHLTLWARFGWPILVMALLAVTAARREHNKTFLIPLTAALVWWAYLASVGGDIFPAWRQVLLGLVPLGLVIAEGAEAWWNTSTQQRIARIALCVVCGALLFQYARSQRADPDNERAKKERWEYEGFSLGPVLAQAWGAKKPLMAVDAAGTLPYFTKFPCIDMLGLNDRYIAMHPPDLTGKLSTGHELGDGAYAMSRKPDILAFCAGMGGRNPCFLGGKQMLAQPGFQQAYQLMRYHTPGPPDLRAELWIRRDGVLGVERSADRVRIPGWLMSEYSGTTELDRGEFRSRTSAMDPSHLERLELPPGTRWKVTVEPASDAWTIGTTCDMRSAARVRAGPPSIEVPPSGRIGIMVGTRGTEPQSIDAVILERVSDEPTFACGAPFDAQFLTARVPDHAMFQQPEGVLMLNAQPLRVRLPAGHGVAFEASLDGNDTYRLLALKAGVVLSESTLPSFPGGGLIAQRFEVAAEADELELTPITGDQLSGLGYLIEVR